MKTIYIVIASLLFGLSGSVMASEEDIHHLPLEKVAPYPTPEPGMSRKVIYLSSKENEDNLKVELVIGKLLELDCNYHQLNGELKMHTLEGWGYDYWILGKLSGPVSTLMACPDNSTRSQFVRVNLGESTLQRYNSRLPLVLYVPQEVEVKYRIWQGEAESHQAQSK